MFLYHQWRLLPIETRAKLATQFNIKKTGPTHVADNVIKDDGYSIADIEKALDRDVIRTYLGTQEVNTEKLWLMLIDKINGKYPLDIETERIQRESADIKNAVGVQTVDADGIPTATELPELPKKRKYNKRK